MNTTTDGVIVVCDSHHGVHLPEVWIRHLLDSKLLHVWQIKPEDAECILQGPEYEHYWDTWDDILDYAELTNEDGTWTLHQDGDLFACCPELMTNEQHRAWFGDDKPVPEGYTDYVACQDCVMLIANDELPPDNTEAEDELLRDAHRRLPGPAFTTDVDLGFVSDECEICGALPSDRHRVLVKEVIDDEMVETEDQ